MKHLGDDTVASTPDDAATLSFTDRVSPPLCPTDRPFTGRPSGDELLSRARTRHYYRDPCVNHN